MRLIGNERDMMDIHQGIFLIIHNAFPWISEDVLLIKIVLKNSIEKNSNERKRVRLSNLDNLKYPSITNCYNWT
jgi:hypothetical protein